MTRRLLLSYLALTLAILAALEIPLALSYQQRVESELTSGLQRDAFALASFAEDTVEGKVGRSIDLVALANNYGDRTGARVVIVDAQADVLADTDPGSPDTNFSSRPEIASALGGQVTSGRRRSATLGTDLLYVTVPIASGEVYGAVRISYSTEQINERIRRYWLTLAGVAAVSLGAASLIGVTMARWVTRPLERVRDGAERLGAGQLEARVRDDAGPPEVRGLARSFNSMASRIDQLVRAQEAFVADASHQLRTPLTALRLRLENLDEELAASSFDPEGRAAAASDVDAALAETHRLSRLVDGLLTLARADRTDPQSSVTTLDVDEVFDDRVAMWEPLAEERGVRLRALPATTGDHPLQVRATPDRLAQVLDNLIANAIEVAPNDSDVVVHANAVHVDTAGGTAGGTVELHVTDAGPGLSEEQRRRAFDRFWRAGTTRSELSGSGLGLAIAQRLARADGGDIELRPADPTGIDAVVTLPQP